MHRSDGATVVPDTARLNFCLEHVVVQPTKADGSGWDCCGGTKATREQIDEVIAGLATANPKVAVAAALARLAGSANAPPDLRIFFQVGDGETIRTSTSLRGNRLEWIARSCIAVTRGDLRKTIKIRVIDMDDNSDNDDVGRRLFPGVPDAAIVQELWTTEPFGQVIAAQFTISNE